MKILSLVLTHQWYDMIASGEKRTEYRAITPHWARIPTGGYTHVRFQRAYDRGAETMILPIERIDIGLPEPGWCPKEAENTAFYRIHLGDK